MTTMAQRHPRRRVAHRRSDGADLHTRTTERRAPADRADSRRVRRHRGAAGARAARTEGLGARPHAHPAQRRTRAARHRRSRDRSAASNWTRYRQSSSANRSATASFATTFGAQTGLAITPLLCFGIGRAQGEIRPRPRERRHSRRLRAERVGLRFRRPRRQGARDAAARRQLRPQRREDVDHQRRLRRSLHRLCEGRRRAVHGVRRRTKFPRRQLRPEEHKLGLHGSSTTPCSCRTSRCRPAT